MSVDKIQMISKEYGNLEYSCPYPRKQDSETVLRASGPFGSILILHELCKDLTISLVQYSIHKRTRLNTSADDESLGFHFILKNNFNYDTDGFPKGIICEHHYNMVYVPWVRNEYNFRKAGEYASFHILFPLSWLQHWVETFPALSAFICSVEQKRPAMTFPNHFPAKDKMLNAVNTIFHCPYTGVAREMYIRDELYSIMTMCFQDMLPNEEAPVITLRPSDIQKIHDARTYILKNINTPGSLSEIAYIVGTNEFKLKKGFRQLYNTTVFGLLLEERLQKAKSLLLDTRLSVKKISILVGYKNLSNFSEAFKKRFGHPPMALRKGKKC